MKIHMYNSIPHRYIQKAMECTLWRCICILPTLFWRRERRKKRLDPSWYGNLWKTSAKQRNWPRLQTIDIMNLNRSNLVCLHTSRSRTKHPYKIYAIWKVLLRIQLGTPQTPSLLALPSLGHMSYMNPQLLIPYPDDWVAWIVWVSERKDDIKRLHQHSNNTYHWEPYTWRFPLVLLILFRTIPELLSLDFLLLDILRYKRPNCGLSKDKLDMQRNNTTIHDTAATMII